VAEKLRRRAKPRRLKPGNAHFVPPPPDAVADALIAFERRLHSAPRSLANTVEFKRWLKGFGAMAEILKPAWLRAGGVAAV
jgi:hypothetical protein